MCACQSQRSRIPREVLPEHLRGLLGVEPVSRDKYGTDGIAGVVTGLAWTAAGGEILS